jgi:transcriptional regulator of nitric oxide reductase
MGWLGRLFWAALVVVALLPGETANAAFDYLENTPPLVDRVTPEILEAVFPGAERIEPVESKGPTAAAAYKGDELLGYVFSTLDVVRAPGYTRTPFDVIGGVSLDGRIMGAVNVFHVEPHIVNDDLRQQRMQEFLGSMAGVALRGQGSSDGLKPTFVAGATVSARAMRAAVRDSARMVLQAFSGRPPVTEPTLDTESFRPTTVAELLEQRYLTEITITNADLQAAMERAGAAAMVPEVEPRGGPDEVYLRLRVGLATAAMIRRNTVGERALLSRPLETQAILLASDGTYDHQGFKFQNRSSGFRLERLHIIQGERTYEFVRDNYSRSGSGPAGRTVGIAFLAPSDGFDPLQPWKAEVLVYAHAADGREAVVPLPALDYTLPPELILLPEPEPVPAWVEAWQAGQTDVIILGGALVVLTLILAFQSVLTRYRFAHRWVRNGFLLFTLVWLGWTVGGQLSIVNVINYLEAPFQSADLGFYLAEPLIVIITLYTAVSLVLLGRGVFCGWLCPFGALQELLAQVARWLRLPQWNPSERLQNKLWLGKYASLAIVLGLVFLAPSAGALAEEVEPFKTAITSTFTRAWPYALYAGLLLSVGLFTERAYCRFLCPLGGALAILDRLHLIDLLKRRPECGSPCRLCERSCPVKAIQTSGKIKMAECFQCLDCQVEYYDDHRCPPLVAARKLGQRNRVSQPPVALPVAARGVSIA